MNPETHLPEAIRNQLTEFVLAAESTLGGDLDSIVLFGSAVENRLRPTSDVNIIVILRSFRREAIDGLREPFRLAHAAIRLNAMFLLRSEIPAAAEAFAVKFSDILERHIVLVGTDPFAGLSIDRAATVRRIKQVLTNLILRMRQQYVHRSLREEQLGPVIADASAPLRSAALAILKLEDKSAASPKEALEIIAGEFPEPHWKTTLERITEVRRAELLEKDAAPDTLFQLIDLAERLAARADQLAQSV